MNETKSGKAPPEPQRVIDEKEEKHHIEDEKHVTDRDVEGLEEEKCRIGMLKDDHLISIMTFIPGHAVAVLTRVCKSWQGTLSDPLLWKFICLMHISRTRWAHEQALALGHWKQVFYETPLVRFDGVYVLKHVTYRMGGLSLNLDPSSVKKVRECAYFRYLRFYSGNKVAYGVTDQDPGKVPMSSSKLSYGRYRTKNGRVQLIVQQPHVKAFIQCDMSEFGKGSHNRLYFVDFRGEFIHDVAGYKYTQKFAVDEFPFRFIPDYEWT